MRLLCLGGTRFVGRAVVEEALARGHQVTLFNRGRTNPDLFVETERLRGDRANDLSALDGREWDAVLDLAAYHPREVDLSTQALRGRVGRYLFVSTVSVYADQSTPPDEDAALVRLEDPEDRRPETYGARKAAAEGIVGAAFAGRATVVRPGMIAGPHDRTDRLSYWPRRLAAGGRVLAPGSPADPVQFIDVRDLASFMLTLVEGDSPGTFNVTGKHLPMGEFLSICARATRSDAELVWVPSRWLVQAGVDPWMGVPLWISAPGWEAANRVPIGRALAAGLTLRPVAETIVSAWHDPDSPGSSFTRADEARLLDAFERGRAS